MLCTLRRLLFLWLLMFWQGGFIFYGAVVVEVGRQTLGDPLQGTITQRVTNWLNLAGAVALAAWAWDIAVEPAPTHLRRRRWLLWLFLVATLAALAWLHWSMDQHMNDATERLTDRSGFRELHRWYLRVSTAQCAAALMLTWATLRAWRTGAARMPIDPSCDSV